jgi:hypothetical protein
MKWKKTCAKWSEGEGEMDGESWSSNVTWHKIIEIQIVFNQKIHNCLGLFPTLITFQATCMSFPLPNVPLVHTMGR